MVEFSNDHRYQTPFLVEFHRATTDEPLMNFRGAIMKFRSRLFGVLALLSLAWICYGTFAYTSYFGDFLNRPTPPPSGSLTSEDRTNIQNAGATIGTGIGFTFVLCTGLPFFALFGLLAWRNSAGLRKEQMHKEQLNAIREAGKSSTT